MKACLPQTRIAGVPLTISVWGNDFTLHAPANGLMRHYTAWAMQVADALHADCQRDIRLGKQWGFDPSRPTLVTPGNGGVRTDAFHPPAEPVEEPVIINARGFRNYVRNDVFFQAIPRVLAKRPDAEIHLRGDGRRAASLEVDPTAWHRGGRGTSPRDSACTNGRCLPPSANHRFAKHA